MTIEYKRSLTELDFILNYMNPEYLKKIPVKFVDFIKANMDIDYIPKIDKNIPISQQELSKDTKVLLSLIYRSYWCDTEKKEILKKQDSLEKQKYEQEIYEKYNPDNLFKNKEKIVTKVTTQELVEYKPQNFIQKLINKILNLFKRK